MTMTNALIRTLENKLLQLIDVGRPLPFQIDITNACNLRCRHCYHPHHKNQGALQTEDLISLIDEYNELISKLRFKPFLILCGGEPTISNNLEPILEHIKQLQNFKIATITNGTTINARILDLYKDFNNPLFQVSLDGPDSSSHDLIRGKGNFDRTIKGVEKLLKNGYQVNLLAVLSKHTSQNLESFFQFSKEIGVKNLGFTRLIGTGYAKSMIDSQIDRPLYPLELKSAFQKIILLSAKYSIKTDLNSPLMNLLSSGLGSSGRFWEGITVDYKGNYLASSRSRLVLGHSKDKSMEEILCEHPIFVKLRKGKIENCGECEHLNVCGGDRNAAFADSGNYLGHDPGCWINIEQKTV